MAIESKDWRIICPFCLRIFNVPVNHLSNQRSSFAKDPANALSSKHEKKDSRLILIDDDMFVIGRYINYHLHCCTTCITESDSDKGEVMCLSMCPGQLFVPLKHSTLIATPLVPDLMCQPCNHLYWPHHRSWNYRVIRLVWNAMKLQSLMAWCNTLGGAHSSLGDSLHDHAAKAGDMSMTQLALSSRLGDDLLQVKSRLFLAFSYIQQRKLSRAKRIIKSEYVSLMKAKEKDQKLINMCLSAWNRYRALQPGKQHHADCKC